MKGDGRKNRAGWERQVHTDMGLRNPVYVIFVGVPGRKQAREHATQRETHITAPDLVTHIHPAGGCPAQRTKCPPSRDRGCHAHVQCVIAVQLHAHVAIQAAAGVVPVEGCERANGWGPPTPLPGRCTHMQHTCNTHATHMQHTCNTGSTGNTQAPHRQHTGNTQATHVHSVRH